MDNQRETNGFPCEGKAFRNLRDNVYAWLQSPPSESCDSAALETGWRMAQASLQALLDEATEREKQG